MPYEILWERAGVYWDYTGILTGQDLLQSNKKIYGDSRFDEMRYQILDMLSVESFDVDLDTMEEITVMDMVAARTNPLVKVAIVATSPQVKRLVEIYETTTGSAPWETEIFKSVEDARVWITSRLGITFG